MLLLTRIGSMTVTQMSNYMEVTKASLYQIIVELVNDGLVSEPEVQVKKNYVEKYYHLNTMAFKAIDPYELQRRLNQGANPVEYKDLLEAFFTSFSLCFQIYAHEVRYASPDRLQKMAQELEEENLLLWGIDLEDEDYHHELKDVRMSLKKVAPRARAKSNRAIRRPERFADASNRIFVIALPRSLMSPGS